MTTEARDQLIAAARARATTDSPTHQLLRDLAEALSSLPVTVSDAKRVNLVTDAIGHAARSRTVGGHNAESDALMFERLATALSSPPVTVSDEELASLIVNAEHKHRWWHWDSGQGYCICQEFTHVLDTNQYESIPGEKAMALHRASFIRAALVSPATVPDEEKATLTYESDETLRFIESFNGDEAGDIDNVYSVMGDHGYAMRGGNDVLAVLLHARAALSTSKGNDDGD